MANTRLDPLALSRTMLRPQSPQIHPRSPANSSPLYSYKIINIELSLRYLTRFSNEQLISIRFSYMNSSPPLKQSTTLHLNSHLLILGAEMSARPSAPPKRIRSGLSRAALASDPQYGIWQMKAQIR